MTPPGLRRPLWEPEWDGYRALAAGGRLWSRNGTILTPLFPDLAPVFAARLPDDVVLDGELVVWDVEAGWLDFASLQSRMTAGRHHPQTCGKVERFHQTVKKWLATQPRAHTITELQTQLDTFRDYYNTVRPHRALNRHTPAHAYTARPKAAASGIALIDGHYRVRHDKIDANGKLTLRYNSRLHHIGLGRRHAHTPVLLLAHDLHIRILTTSGQLLRDFQLDPSRDYQPQQRETPPA